MKNREKELNMTDKAYLSLFEERINQNFIVESEWIREKAHGLHAHVNQTYGDNLPYGYHLDMVAGLVARYADEVCRDEADMLPLYFGAYFHDSIEDARLTYNDVMKLARQILDERQAYLATEIVYALTNEKGRNRHERANEKYYQGIRETPYAPFVKLADRMANMTYSCVQQDGMNNRMRDVYRNELPHFMAAIDPGRTDDSRFSLPEEMVGRLKQMVE